VKLRKLIYFILVIILISGSDINAADRTLKMNHGMLNLTRVDLNQEGTIQLNGEWEFYWRKFLKYGEFQNVKPDIFADVPNTWDNYTMHGKMLPRHGYATYRLRVKTNIDKGTLLGLNIYNFSSAYKLYVNEKLIASNGKIAKKASGEVGDYRPKVILFKAPAKEFEIILQISNFSYARGGFWYRLSIGNAEDTIRLHEATMGKEIFIVGILIIISLFYMAMYILQREFKYCLYFSCTCMCLLVAFDMVGQLVILTIFPNLSFKSTIFLWYSFGTWVIFFALLYIHELFKSNFSRIVVKIVFCFCVLSQIIIAVTSPSFYSIFGHFIDLFDAVGALCAVIMVIIGIKNGKKDGWLNIASVFLMLVIYIHDNLYWENKISDGFGEIIYIGIFLIIFTQMVIQAKRIQIFNYKKTAAELSFLQAQIKPHFLYNTLNTFISISHYDVDKARNLLCDFSNYLRRSFDFKDLSQFVPLKNEIELAKAYAKIQKARYEERLEINFDIDEDIDIAVPRLVLQPIIENAINHGIFPKCEGGKVEVCIKIAGNTLNFQVKDDGVGMNEKKLREIFNNEEKAGIGLLNIQRRLKKLYRKGLNIKSELGVGTDITWQIPIKKKI
jgi:two-component system LytT family sensor kinase